MSSHNPFRDASDPPQQPFTAASVPQSVPTRSSSASTGVIIGVVIAVGGGVLMLFCGGILIGLLLPAVQSAREAARRMQCQNNLKQIALGLHNYQSEFGVFPPAYTVSADGQPLHSWRTLILPYMEYKDVYDRIDLEKPWDDPVNQPIAELDLPFYRCPSTELRPGLTTYVAVVDPLGVFEGTTAVSPDQITDGLSNTLLVVETDTQNAVNWMQPADLTLAQFQSLSAQSPHTGGSNMCLADGSVQFLGNNADPGVKAGLVTKAAGESISLGVE